MAGLYIHIPFCRHKCAYCDFFSAPVRGDVVEQYLDALLAEWRLRRHELGSDPITTLYIGGGTPSMVPLNAMRRFMEALGREIPLGTLSEATIEANPEDITTDSIAAYRAMGFNRISVGIQSFDSGQLDAVDRRHTPQASRDALRALSLSGINYSADLIYGLPGQSTAQWQENLAELFSYRPPHFSSYLLSYEPGTRLYARLMKGEVEEASDTLAQQMYAILCEAADSHGYHHYEISNLALPGREAIHNSSYWRYTPYLGLGTGAHSFDGTLRRFNPTNIKQYIATLAGGRPFFQVDNETAVNRFNDYIITSLRTTAGFSTRFAAERFGAEAVKAFMRNAAPLLASGRLLPASETLPGTTNAPESASTAPESASDTRLSIPRPLWLTSDAILRDLILDSPN